MRQGPGQHWRGRVKHEVEDRRGKLKSRGLGTDPGHRRTDRSISFDSSFRPALGRVGGSTAQLASPVNRLAAFFPDHSTNAQMSGRGRGRGAAAALTWSRSQPAAAPPAPPGAALKWSRDLPAAPPAAPPPARGWSASRLGGRGSRALLAPRGGVHRPPPPPPAAAKRTWSREGAPAAAPRPPPPAPAPAPRPPPRAPPRRAPPPSRAAGALLVRQLVGQQNCALVYRVRPGRSLQRAGVQGGRGGANMTWVSRSQPRLRAAAVAAAAAAAGRKRAAPPAPAPPPKRPRVPTPAPAPLRRVRPRPPPPRPPPPPAAAAGGLRLRPLCLAFCRSGRCRRPACNRRHDADKVAVCGRWLSGGCADAACPLTHKARGAAVASGPPHAQRAGGSKPHARLHFFFGGALRRGGLPVQPRAGESRRARLRLLPGGLLPARRALRAEAHAHLPRRGGGAALRRARALPAAPPGGAGAGEGGGGGGGAEGEPAAARLCARGGGGGVRSASCEQSD